MQLIAESKCFGGKQAVFTHPSKVCGCDMTFAVYLPPQAQKRSVPVLWYLSGLTCTHENAMSKAGLQQYASKNGIAIVYPDTSPRGDDIADDGSYDLGQGAGFYVNATEKPWAPHFNMYDYVVKELMAIICSNFHVTEHHGITGHSMGGHGALTIALRNPKLFKSVSAFAPITNPTASDWGRKQFTAYLGKNEKSWVDHDACLLIEKLGWDHDILIDQGLSDQFIDLLRPEAFAEVTAKQRISAMVRTHAGYDHSYFFVCSFAHDHVEWHAQRLIQ